jgi:signal transduction histidine kinase
MSEGGHLVIRLRHDRENDRVELTVRDNGSGIAEDRLPKIFEPFYSTKAGPDATGKGGTGLGLSACRQIVQAHQGTIRVASTVGRGTAFIIRFPLTASPANAPPSSAA